MEGFAGQQFVGMDLHRRRSVIVRTVTGEVLETVRIGNDVEQLWSVMGGAGVDPDVALEATYGWYWALDPFRGCATATGCGANCRTWPRR